MRVGGPGIRVSETVHQVGTRRSRCRPQAKCAIHVYPRPGFMSARDDLARRIERSGIDIARLQADDGGAVDRRKGVRAHPPMAIYGNCYNAFPPQTKHTKRLEERWM